MTTAPKVCPTCGAEIPPDAPEGGCPGCLLQTGLDPLVNEDGHPSDLTRVQPGTGSERSVEMLGDLRDYELLEEVGRGGQGVVFRARQKSLNRTVALKVISLGQWASTADLKRFRREAEAAASLDHPSIVPIYEVGEREGACYFSMKFIEGGQLDEVVKRAPMSIRQAAELIAKVARTVHYAHEHGILHRDIKPGNILLDAKGEPHLTDFGLARLVETESTVTRTMEVLGTPSYMAPEQAVGNNARVTSATDIYGLGAVFYQTLTGHPPFAGGTTFETVRLVLDAEPPQPRVLNPKIDRDLATICLKCLEKDPQRRYSSALALAEDLERWLKHQPIRARRTGIFSWGKKWVRRNPTIVLLILSLAALAAAIGWNVWKSELVSSPAATGIAVLPLTNLSEEKENAFFADGIQDELLSNLSKIKDLKVISRTSVMQYKSGITRNLKEIAQQLGVSNVVEGSVRRSGNRIRVSVQLIDAQTDRHVWAQNYDRTLADSLALQGELATEIAAGVGATLSPQEKARVEAKPTNNPVAYDAYLRARAFAAGSPFDKPTVENAIRSYQEAVKLDPAFALAWARLSYAQSNSYWLGHDPSPAQLAAAKDAADHALALDPNLPETHLALGYYRYYGQRDFTGGLEEFQQAEKGLPNNVDITNAIALIQRRLGHWEEAIDRFRRVVELDPRNTNAYNSLAATYRSLRRFPEALATVDRVLVWEPTNADLLAIKANVFWATGDLQAVEPLLGNPGIDPQLRGFQALFQRRYPAAIETFSSAMAVATKRGEPSDSEKFNLGLSQQRAGDVTAARATYQNAVQDIERDLEKVVPDSYPAAAKHASLGLAYAGLGEAASAIAEGEKAMAMRPTSKDPSDGPGMEEFMADIYALLGDADHSIPILKRLLQIPYSGAITPACLRLDPVWDQIRNDPRFQKLVATGIAVLPFENRSDDKANAYFADGVQDEILTDLAKVADLKVISRTSVMPYKSGMARNVREIGQQLGVAHVVEGSVQRSGNRVRVNAQLIDARTDRHLWAQTYDRDLADVFAIQSEIAKTIAEQLQAKLSPREENAIELHPTSDISAFDLYARAKNILLAASDSTKAELLQAVDLLNQAVIHDPSFFDAYCQLAYAHDALYWFGLDHTSARLALAEAAIQSASRLRPDAGETHLARAQNLYWAYDDYDGALAELEVARQTLPNDARIFDLTGNIQRRQGRWEESTRNFERVVELNPRDVGTLVLGIAWNYSCCRRYAEAKPWLARVLAFEPNNSFAKVFLAYADFDSKADTQPFRQTIDSIRVTNPAAVPSIAHFWIICALAERDAAAAKDALIGFGEEPIGFAPDNFLFNRPFAEGVIARMTKDDEKARSAFTAARAEQEKIVQAQPNYGPALCALGLIDAGLGRKEEALREGRRAVELLPVTKDSMKGTHMVKYLAIIAAWVGDKDLACEQLASIIGRPSSPSYGQLKLLPFWDPLRGDPRFEKLVEESKQPFALK